MIKLNLDSIMKEKNLSISDISKDTGIARSTLTPIVKNPDDVKSVRFDTLDKLCGYLDVDLSDLLIYSPNKTGMKLIKMWISKNREFGIFEIKRITTFSEKSAFVSFGIGHSDSENHLKVALEIMDNHELSILNNKVKGFEIKNSLEPMEQKDFKQIIQNASRKELFELTLQIAISFFTTKQHDYDASTIELYWAVGSLFLDGVKNTFIFDHDKINENIYDISDYNDAVNTIRTNSNISYLDSEDFKIFFEK
ncbi:helix-turn-helix domain-containing protein [Carnobacterium pleistocenium]|uniref:helix-turn-helix domain-containing protein n=1 Tax=Carnobacterium pleistocenium TaxID=181073 RepID=UPI000A020A5B|nr:helix-turn-helix transcriptional regulator [Carnobacterium pleistocenium]